MSDHDPVQKPKHYNFGQYEVIRVIEDWKLGYHLGNVVKYVARAPYKGEELQDLKKAVWYLQRKIMLLEMENEIKKYEITRTEITGIPGEIS